jgi:hypothetical protein
LSAVLLGVGLLRAVLLTGVWLTAVLRGAVLLTGVRLRPVLLPSLLSAVLGSAELRAVGVLGSVGLAWVLLSVGVLLRGRAPLLLRLVLRLLRLRWRPLTLTLLRVAGLAAA